MDSKYVKVDKNQQIEKILKNIASFVFCMFLTKALCPVLPHFARAPHIYDILVSFICMDNFQWSFR